MSIKTLSLLDKLP